VSSADLLVKRKSAVPDDLRIKRGGDVLLAKNDVAEKLMLRCCESCGGVKTVKLGAAEKQGAAMLLVLRWRSLIAGVWLNIRAAS
jgi:hypothetical protein